MMLAQENGGLYWPAPPHKTRIISRLDTDILDWFRHQVNEAGGGTYQTMMTAARREHLQRRGKPLEEVRRQVIREELLAFREYPARYRAFSLSCFFLCDPLDKFFPCKP